MNRNKAFDILRIIAAVSVVMLHTSGMFMDRIGVMESGFAVGLFMNSISRFGVPIFVMISGALFLDKERETDVKKLWTRNILRVLVAFILWGYAYYAYNSIFVWDFDFLRQGLARTVKGIVYGSNHLWFLYMIAGLYAITPILSDWIKHTQEKVIRYLLSIYFVFQILRVTVNLLMNNYLVNELAAITAIDGLTGYIGYYVLGYYLKNYSLKKWMRNVIYATVPVGIAVNFTVALLFSRRDLGFNAGIYDSFGLFTYLQVIALFYFVLHAVNEEKPEKKLRGNLSKDTFGLYLMHPMVLAVLDRQGFFESFLANPLMVVCGIVTLVLLVSVICVPIAAILRRIPFVGRYIC